MVVRACTLKEDAETRHFSHLLGIFRKQDASIFSNIDPALQFILRKRLVSTSLHARREIWRGKTEFYSDRL